MFGVLPHSSSNNASHSPAPSSASAHQHQTDIDPSPSAEQQHKYNFSTRFGQQPQRARTTTTAHLTPSDARATPYHYDVASVNFPSDSSTGNSGNSSFSSMPMGWSAEAASAPQTPSRHTPPPPPANFHPHSYPQPAMHHSSSRYESAEQLDERHFSTSRQQYPSYQSHQYQSQETMAYGSAYSQEEADYGRQSSPQAEYPTDSFHAAHLHGTGVDYVPVTAESKIDLLRDTSSRVFKLFIGHVTEGTTPEQLRWIIQYLTGVTIGRTVPRGTGCFLVFFKNFDDLCRVRRLHRRALFDLGGVWYAPDTPQEETMKCYVATVLSQRRRQGLRLPKGMMVVDDVEKRAPRRGGNSQTNSADASETNSTA